MHNCPYCLKSFPKGKSLGGHIMKVHADAPPPTLTAFDRATKEVPNLETGRTYPYHSHDRTWWLCPVCGEHLYTMDGDHITATWCCPGCLSIVNRQGEILSRYEGSALDRRAVRGGG